MVLALDRGKPRCILGMSTFKVRFCVRLLLRGRYATRQRSTTGETRKFWERIRFPEMLSTGGVRVGALDLKMFILRAGKPRASGVWLTMGRPGKAIIPTRILLV